MPAFSQASRAATMSGMNKPQKAIEPQSEDEEHEAFEDASDDESDNGDFPKFDKMPAQHPATRTTAQLMGK